jgi:hypothetical protein
VIFHPNFNASAVPSYCLNNFATPQFVGPAFLLRRQMYLLVRQRRIAWSESSEQFSARRFMTLKWGSMMFGHDEYVGAHRAFKLLSRKHCVIPFEIVPS